MSVRSHHELSWWCCGYIWDRTYGYCPICGHAVATVTKVVAGAPTLDGKGQWVIATRGDMTANDWRMIAKMAEIAVAGFDRQESQPIDAARAAERRDQEEGR